MIIEERQLKTLKKIWIVIIIVCLIGALILPLLYLIDYARAPSDYDFIDECVSRKITYCLRLDPSLDAVKELFIPIPVLLFIMFGSTFLYIAVKLGFPAAFIPVMILLCFFTGSFFFTPYILLHEHFDEPSIEYFLRNVILSLFLSLALFFMAVIVNRKVLKRKIRIIALCFQFCAVSVATYCFTSLFYIFSMFGGAE